MARGNGTSRADRGAEYLDALHAARSPLDDDDEWTPIDLAALALREPQPPHFIVDGWLPAGYATLLAGHGGVGKSAIALMLAVSIALGRSFAGLAVERRRVL